MGRTTAHRVRCVPRGDDFRGAGLRVLPLALAVAVIAVAARTGWVLTTPGESPAGTTNVTVSLVGAPECPEALSIHE